MNFKGNFISPYKEHTSPSYKYEIYWNKQEKNMPEMQRVKDILYFILSSNNWKLLISFT